MMRLLTSAVLTFLFLCGDQVCAQSATKPDSIPAVVVLETAVIEPGPSLPKDHKCQPGSKRFHRLEKRVLKVWPYAEFAGFAMDSLENELAFISAKKNRKALIAAKEEALKARFEGELRRLTIREGILLIRLIDRQAQKTTFGVVQELKGRLSAVMWQGLARIFGHDLKSEYDAAGEDAAIEYIIQCHGLDQAKPKTPAIADSVK